MNIPFNKPTILGTEINNIKISLQSGKLSGDSKFSRECENWFESRLNVPKALLTPSGTHSLEMAALLCGISTGDEIIMPSYTFVSTANAFVLRGAKIVFVDIRRDTMNIDETLIEEAITSKTKAIVVVHYAGVSCEMDSIIQIADKHNLLIIEDAAQGMMSKYKGRDLGTFGVVNAYSFHETKNYTSGGEGGLTIITDKDLVLNSEIIREKGTNRSQFFKGQVDKYTWVNVGSSYLPSEIQAAYLMDQLENAELILEDRMNSWSLYYQMLTTLKTDGRIDLMFVPEHCEHNAHMFYIKCKNDAEREKLITFLKNNGIHSTFHYVPLHSSPAGLKYSKFHGKDKNTTTESLKLLRLPLWYNMKPETVERVVESITKFYN